MVTLKPGCKIRLQAHILTADSWEEIEINPTYFTWNWNASEIFPDLAPNQFLKAMQSLNNYGLHIVDAADISHHLKFANFEDPTPKNITELFSNPLHYISIIIALIMFIVGGCFLYRCFQNKIHDKLKATLPTSIAMHIGTAPPAYVHNDPSDLPRVNLKF
jgi:hypothetical protein